MYIVACVVCSVLVIVLADYVYKYISRSWGSASSLARKEVEEKHADVTRNIAENMPTKPISPQAPDASASNGSIDANSMDDPYGLGEYAKELLK